MNRSNLAILASVAVAIGAMTASNPAHAALDYKVFNTMNCVPNGTSAANDLTYSYLGVLNTSSTENRVVICPIMKDADNHITDDNPASVTVSYTTASSMKGTVNCSIQVGFCKAGGGSYYSSTSTNVEQAANTSAEFSLAVRTDPSNFLPAETVLCALSPRTRLTRIILREDGPTQTP